MSKEEVLERALRSYMAYYDVERETPEEPFAAEAAFHSHSSTYFLTKSATIGEAESNEYVFFALADRLDEELFRKLDHAAWEKGLARVKPHANHRNSDISLVVIASSVTEGAGKSGPQAETLQELPPESSRVQPLSSDCFRSFQ